jgi:hypothetical protein
MGLIATSWTREFIEGRTVYVVRPAAGDAIGAANTVFQLLPMLMTGEEIRIRPEGSEPPSGNDPYNPEQFTPYGAS